MQLVLYVSKKNQHMVTVKQMRKLYHLNFTVDNLDGLQSSQIASLIMQLVVLFVSKKSAYSSCDAK
jgi:hypothetical protein